MIAARPGYELPLALIDIVAKASLRDERGNLVRNEEHHVTVLYATLVREVVLALVCKWSPAAAAHDITWDTDPATWDGAGELRWSTCAEIDGVVRHRRH